MKKLLFASLLLLTAISCKKEDEQTKAYNIEVNVRDRVNYTIIIGNTPPVILNSSPDKINASYKTSAGFKPSEAAFVSVTSIDQFKDEYFEVVITNSSTGSVVTQKKEKGNVVVTWNVKNN